MRIILHEPNLVNAVLSLHVYHMNQIWFMHLTNSPGYNAFPNIKENALGLHPPSYSYIMNVHGFFPRLYNHILFHDNIHIFSYIFTKHTSRPIARARSRRGGTVWVELFAQSISWAMCRKVLLHIPPLGGTLYFLWWSYFYISFHGQGAETWSLNFLPRVYNKVWK